MANLRLSPRAGAYLILCEALDPVAIICDGTPEVGPGLVGVGHRWVQL